MGLGAILRPKSERPAPANAMEIGSDGGLTGGIFFTPWAGVINDAMSMNATPVTQDVAEGILGVGRGVDLICGVMCQLQPELYDNEFTQAYPTNISETPPILQNPDPNWHFLPEWLTAVSAALAWHGNAYAYRGPEVCDSRGYPKRLPLIDPERIFWDGADYRLITADSGPDGEPIDRNDIVHFMLGARAGRQLGEGILARYQMALQIMLATEKAQWVVMKNGKPMGIISMEVDLTPEEAREYKTDFLEAVRNDGIAAMSYAKFSAIDWSSHDLSMIPTREFNLKVSSDITGVPGYLLGVPAESRIYSNMETEWSNFIRVTLGKYIATIQGGLSSCFPRSKTVRIPTDRLTKPDLEVRFKTYEIGVTIGAITPAEVRQLENMPPRPDIAGGPLEVTAQPAQPITEDADPSDKE